MRSRKVKSVPQRKLMGYAYACATGKAENCPDSIMSVAKSFTKKNKKKGLAALRSRAKTKHAGLSPTRITESRILKFNEFKIMEEFIFDDDQSAEVIQFLYELRIDDLTELLNEFLQLGSEISKKEYIEDIMTVLAKKAKSLSQEKLSWIEDNLKKRID